MSSNSYELGWAPRQRWSPSTRAQRAAERRAELASSLAAADKLVASSSASSSPASASAPGDDEPTGGNKWQSISALERSCNFNRLKKGYASVRKSFRLPERSGNVQAADNREEPARPRGLVNQLGVGAARLLRGVYQKGRQQHLLEADSISSITGSFKVLTPSATYSSQQPAASTSDQSSVEVAAKPKKSAAELEIEHRLHRSRGRVLPSASYTAPQSDRACDGLNLEELEEIKRDNLRLTLLKSQTFLRSERDKPAGKEAPRSPSVGCSCKALEPGGEPTDDYCCCRSISSSFSSLSASRLHLDGGEEFNAVEGDKHDDDSSRALGGFVGDKIFHSMEEIVAQGGERELEKVCGKLTLASSLASSDAQLRRLADNNCDDGGQLGGVGQKSRPLMAPDCRTTTWAKRESTTTTTTTTKQHANGGARVAEIHSAESNGHGQSNECDDHQSCRAVARARPKVTTVTTSTLRVVKGGKVVKAGHLSVENVNNSAAAAAATLCGRSVTGDRSVEIINKDEEQRDSAGKMMFHEQRRGQYLEEPIYGTCQQQQLQEQHLYASISSSPHTPSPSHQHHYDQNQHQWRRMSQDYDYGERQLYEKQLHHLYPTPRDSRNETKQSTKKSLFSRIKHLIIAPAANGSQQTGKGGQWDALSVDKQRHEPQGMRWQKSATLNSRSAQNLLGSSLRAYLSTSRKSINLADLNETGERENGAKLGLKPLTSGFFTLGRKGLSRQGKYDKPAASQLFALSGSVDSLPSADSGMSCGNLQAANSNSSDENYSTMAAAKSQANPYWQPMPGSNSQQQAIDQRQVIGRARAKVDCNPCAYDKEALVFKCGDIIEILERDQSGTWVGQCGGQVGHFKFINVTELPEEEVEEASEPGEKANYVTKLEIRNNRIELQQQPSFRQRRLGSCTRPISTTASQREPPQPPSMRSTETEKNIMSSLEQLLFAIGLADERVAGSSADVRNHQSTCSPSAKVTYLDILDRGGIKSLDSFSEINDWHELEQMGIKDDEHQRRLLMAARIIRQASMAAKLDFVENYRLSKSNGGSKGRETNGFDQSQQLQERPYSYRHQQQEPPTRNSIRGDVNEPIYVNLVNGCSGGPIVCDGAQVEREVHDLDQGNGWQPSARLHHHHHHQHAGIDRSKPHQEQNALSSPHLSGAGSKQTTRPSHGRQASERQQLNDCYIQNRPIRDSINQAADHYRPPSNWLAGRESRPASGSERGTPIEGGHRRLHYQHQVSDPNNDEEVCTVNGEDDDEDSMIAVDGTSPLVRGYSMRVSRKSRHHPRNNNIDLNVHNQDCGQIYGVLRQPPSPPVIKSRNRFHDVCGDTSAGYQNFSDHHNRKPQSVQTTFNPSGRQLAPAARVSRFVRPNNKQEIGNEASLRSHFNSKSAYDLRLDLSHFFS